MLNMQAMTPALMPAPRDPEEPVPSPCSLFIQAAGRVAWAEEPFAPVSFTVTWDEPSDSVVSVHTGLVPGR
jgi:hypothetical protein